MRTKIKTCKRGHEKTTENTGRGGRCKTCKCEYDRKRYAANPEKQRERRRKYRKANPEKQRECRRKWQLKSKYGLTEAEHEAMLEQQNGLCRICGKAEKLVVDHNHETGKVRGLLCPGCNKGIGFLGDTSEGVQKALTYLQNSEKI